MNVKCLYVEKYHLTIVFLEKIFIFHKKCAIMILERKSSTIEKGAFEHEKYDLRKTDDCTREPEGSD